MTTTGTSVIAPLTGTHVDRPHRLRRAVDVMVSLAVLLTLSVPLLLIAAVIRLTSPGPVFFLQDRVGRGGRDFKFFKFRTMRSAPGGPEITVAGDRRITPVGRLLRALKIDELPQFWNILRGDMTLLGPRPEVPRFVRHYTAEQRELLNYRPGLASVSVVLFPAEAEVLSRCPDPEAAYIRDWMPLKVAADLEYERTRTAFADLRLVGRIAALVVGGSARSRRAAAGRGASDGRIGT